MNKTYLLLGSNMGDSRLQLSAAIKNISMVIGEILDSSSLYSTKAWGNTDQPDFLNQVIVVHTSLAAQEVLSTILEIESRMGRVRTIKNAPRVIDIDILFFNEEIINQNNLKIPHPEIENRRFVLVPLNQLAPHFQHPVSKENMQTLLLNCPDLLEVKEVL